MATEEDYIYFTLLDTVLKLDKETLEIFYLRHYKNKPSKWILKKFTLDNTGYLRGSFNKKPFLLHRIIYYAFNLDWNIYDTESELKIDHIDGDKLNNNLYNLRLVTQQENCFNKHNIKGYTKINNKYRVQIGLNGKKFYFGFYNTEEEAHEKYLLEKPSLHIIQVR